MNQFWYRFWATLIVWLTQNQSLREASCWRVEVVKGAQGILTESFFSTAFTIKSLDKGIS